ncbi:hypothetical protein PQ465_18230 [Sphingobacterium oryzagri]|uniref:Uncharacterized protein n=1 Tax=Sphingobacterium oryzagri TaxID=3025669 RepID=A0ABY7WF26_9SPHI|nr:hypothetical protein [Sphingobacterium sp. KACC 22765]WDF68224.1 hypothetical protein PQ465_18230 [Sphingobacterium sp. KACC 22765]
MKKKQAFFLIIWSLFVCIATVQAQTIANSDSLNYEQQRTRVNNLLEERSKRFGEFDQSLQKKTGIFGIFKTKSDMQKSIDILKQVVIADNNIFVETKRLLDIKDYESDKHAALAKEYDKQVSAYMKTITKLQDQNEQLRLQVSTLDGSDQQNNFFVYLLIGIVILLSVLLYQRYRKDKDKNLTKD